MNRKVGQTPPANPTVLFRSASGSAAIRLAVGELPSKESDVLRFVIISDTHERHRLVVVPEGDVLLYCGDILMSSSLVVQSRSDKILRDFNEWLEGLPCQEKVVIGGNHDTALQRLGEEGQEVLSAAFLLQDSSVTLPRAGVKVYGHSFSEGLSHNRAWQDPLHNCSACSSADVVLTHGLSSAIKEKVLSHNRPRLWASGHLHQEHGVAEVEGTIFANGSILDHRHEPAQPPVVVDLKIIDFLCQGAPGRQ